LFVAEQSFFFFSYSVDLLIGLDANGLNGIAGWSILEEVLACGCQKATEVHKVAVE
jgi:hypothetical protein